jgi:ADP-dependent NAD(P)H-hydrate dehydratase / NAD(P)H-hydrate epimerase
MDREYWSKQTQDKPLFPNLIWSRPENRATAGKLLIIGGNAHGFAAPAEAYAESLRAGAGASRVILPDTLQKTVGKVFPAGEYVPSTPSGSFARSALTELIGASSWADACLLAGDFGHNSETAVLLEQYVEKYKGVLAITMDGLDYFVKHPPPLLKRENTLVVASFAQLQKIATGAKFNQAFTSDMDLLRLVATLHDFSLEYTAVIVVKHLDNTFVAYGGRVSSTPQKQSAWSVKAAARAAVWWLQNPEKSFEAVTTGMLQT